MLSQVSNTIIVTRTDAVLKLEAITAVFQTHWQHDDSTLYPFRHLQCFSIVGWAKARMAGQEEVLPVPH